MTPATQSQKSIEIQSEQEAQKTSDTLTRIFKKMEPFPAKIEMPKMFVGIDLGKSSWKVTFMTDKQPRHSTIKEPHKHEEFLQVLHRQMEKAGVTSTRDVVVCYEIGRDGLWIREYLMNHGIACVIFSPDVICGQPGSAKTDKIDSTNLAIRLKRFFMGDLTSSHIHMPPPSEVINYRALFRERARLVGEKTAHVNEIKSILARYGEVPKGLSVLTLDLAKQRDALGRPLPECELCCLEMILSILKVIVDSISKLDKMMEDICKTASENEKKGKAQSLNFTRLARLLKFKGIGVKLAWCLVYELYYKDFRNTGQVSSATGLTDTPYASGKVTHHQGISRRSNNRLRGHLVELGWLWQRLQPGSPLTTWFRDSTDKSIAHCRMKKVAIVAMARKLAVALWKYIEKGEPLPGAVMKKAA